MRYSEARALGLKKYISNKPCLNGHLSERHTRNGQCIECEALWLEKNRERILRRGAARQKKYRERMTPEKKMAVKERMKSYLIDNKEIISIKRKALYQKNKAKELLKSKLYKERNKAAVTQKVHEYQKRNPDLLKEINALRRATTLERTPRWLTKEHRGEIRKIYKTAKNLGTSFHVDHIFPLRGKTFSGLHVPWNLQIIPARENISKKNKMPNGEKLHIAFWDVIHSS